MPYLNVSRKWAASTSTYLEWSQVMATSVDHVVSVALEETGVTVVELLDDARSRILVRTMEPRGTVAAVLHPLWPDVAVLHDEPQW